MFSECTRMQLEFSFYPSVLTYKVNYPMFVFF